MEVRERRRHRAGEPRRFKSTPWTTDGRSAWSLGRVATPLHAAYNRAMRWLTVALLALWTAIPRGGAGAAWTLPDEEVLSYAIKLGGWTVVDATFALRSRDRAADQHTVFVEATTTSIPSRIYRVRNVYETLVDVRTGLPQAYRKECDEARFQESSSVEYDQADGTAMHTGGARASRRVVLAADTHNLFTALYYLRRHDFTAYPMTDFHLDAKGVYWHARATRTRNLRTAYGDLWEVRVDFTRAGGLDEPVQSDLLTDNIVRADTPLTLHIRPGSTDPARPPMVVRMEYEVRGFGLTAVLRDEDKTTDDDDD